MTKFEYKLHASINQKLTSHSAHSQLLLVGPHLHLLGWGFSLHQKSRSTKLRHFQISLVYWTRDEKCSFCGLIWQWTRTSAGMKIEQLRLLWPAERILHRDSHLVVLLWV